MRTWLVLLLFSVSFAIVAGESADELLERAKESFQAGKPDDAIAQAGRAIEADAKFWPAYLLRAHLYAESRAIDKAAADYGKVLELEPRATQQVYSARGTLYFKARKVAESLADFDALVKLNPEYEPQLWQRGISQYYVGKFEEGRKQFELQRTVNPNDVEVSAWHFLCNARANGIERARKEFMSIDGDSRVPMKEVLQLFKGDLKPADVLAAAEAGNPPPETLKRQQFYAHLYIGLFHEALGETEKAKEHILKAADGYGENDYMVDVAKVHAAQWKK